ncbi:membrane protein [Planotetraspora silvatica]|uniref:Membrane protein n=1 Tax=Planotetraspora silvatica TaxID=234614 RepID=A0A8J3XPG8_9ACTN|nr:DUF4191 domain-containing protein [Planotetraspora silvatica]GII43938.1 membrane protein [Planotetraspora silvatica]
MAKDPAAPGRLKQIRMLVQITKQGDPKAMPIVYASALGTLVVFVVLGLFFGWTWYVTGVFAAVLVGMFLFGRRSQSAQYTMMDGQPGASLAVIKNMRGNWYVDEKPAAFNRDQDFVFRVVGYPGVVLVSEGPGTRVQKMLVAEKKRVQRVAIDIPVYDIQCGNGEGQVPLAKLQRHLMKLPRNLKKPVVSEVNNRMRALTPAMPIPKGPMPRSQQRPR